MSPSSQVFGRLVLLLYGVPDTETAPHGGHLSIKLLPGDLVVKAQPAELDLHPEKRVERKEMVKGEHQIQSTDNRQMKGRDKRKEKNGQERKGEKMRANKGFR